MNIFLSRLFYPIFFLIFLLSFFLIEGEYKFYLFAVWSFFLIFYSRFLEIKKNLLAKSTKLAMMLSVFFALTVFFSSHLPLSLEKLAFYLLSLALFIFFQNLSKQFFSQKLFLYYLSVFSLILNFFVLFFTFSDPQSPIFPGMNLLVRTYGHNHYAAYLLLVVPVFWYQFLFAQDEQFLTKKEIKFLTVLLLLSSYLIMIFSLARLALTISLLQLLIIFLFNKKSFLHSSYNELAYVISKAFIFTFISVIAVFLFLSIPLNQKGENICPLIFSQKELCKPLFQNDRFFYWQRAWLIFRTQPFFGSGLKTFNYAIRQFLAENHLITSYAHNIFLHNLAETGFLTGGFFIFFICYLFVRGFKIRKVGGNQTLLSFLYLAAASSLVNALFDFDWHFFVIFSLTLIFLALILREQTSFLVDTKNQTRLKQNLSLKIYFGLIFLFAVFFALSHFLANTWYKKNNHEAVLKFFPYLNFQITNLINQGELSTSNYQSLYHFYQHDPNFLHKFSSSKDLQNSKRVELQIELSRIDPAFFIKNLDFEQFTYREAQPLIDQIITIVDQYQFLNNTYFFDYWQQRNLAVQIFRFANEAYSAKDPVAAATLYRQAMLFNPFVANDLRFTFFSDVDMAQAVTFLNAFKDFNAEAMGQNFYQYMDFYEQTLIYLFNNQRLDEFYVLAEAIFSQQANFSWFLWRDLLAISKTDQQKADLKKIHQRFQNMSTWGDFVQELSF